MKNSKRPKSNTELIIISTVLVSQFYSEWTFQTFMKNNFMTSNSNIARFNFK